MDGNLPDLSHAEVKTSKSPALDVPSIVDDELQKLGYGDNARLALVSNLGRENSWNPQTIFQGHSDPYNRAYNRGLISWQGNRRENLNNYIQQNGGDFTPSEQNLRLQTQFLDKELQGNQFGNIGRQIKNPNLSLDQAYPLLQKYILYRPEHESENKKWEVKARGMGLGKLPDLSHAEVSGDSLPDLSAAESDGLPDLSHAEVAPDISDNQSPIMPPNPTVATPQTLQNQGEIGVNTPDQHFTIPESNIVDPSINRNQANNVPVANSPATTQPPQFNVSVGTKDFQPVLTDEQKANLQQNEQPQNTTPSIADLRQADDQSISKAVQAQGKTTAPLTHDQIVAGNTLVDKVPVQTDDFIQSHPELAAHYLASVAMNKAFAKYGVTPEEVQDQLEYEKNKNGGYIYNSVSGKLADPEIAERVKNGEKTINYTPTYLQLQEIENRRKGVSNDFTPSTPDEVQQRELKERYLPTDDQLRQRAIDELAQQRQHSLVDNVSGALSGSDAVTDKDITDRMNLIRPTLLPNEDAFNEAIKAGKEAGLGDTGYHGSVANWDKLVAGIIKASPLSAPNPGGFTQSIADYLAPKLSQHADKEEIIAALADKDKSAKAWALNQITGLPVGLLSLGLTSFLPGGPIVQFGALHGLTALGENKPWQSVAGAAATGATTGAIFHGAPIAGQVAEDFLPAFKSVAELGTIAGGSFIQSRANGGDLTDSFRDALSNSLFHAWGLAKEKMANKSGRAYMDGQAVDYYVDGKGLVSIGKIDGEPENRIILDPGNEKTVKAVQEETGADSIGKPISPIVRRQQVNSLLDLGYEPKEIDNLSQPEIKNIVDNKIKSGQSNDSNITPPTANEGQINDNSATPNTVVDDTKSTENLPIRQETKSVDNGEQNTPKITSQESSTEPDFTEIANRYNRRYANELKDKNQDERRNVHANIKKDLFAELSKPYEHSPEAESEIQKTLAEIQNDPTGKRLEVVKKNYEDNKVLLTGWLDNLSGSKLSGKSLYMAENLAKNVSQYAELLKRVGDGGSESVLSSQETPKVNQPESLPAESKPVEEKPKGQPLINKDGRTDFVRKDGTRISGVITKPLPDREESYIQNEGGVKVHKTRKVKQYMFSPDESASQFQVSESDLSPRELKGWDLTKDEFKKQNGNDEFLTEQKRIDLKKIFGVEYDFGKVEPARQKDVEKYKERYEKEGTDFPPIRVQENKEGTYNITDGHRRTQAANELEHTNIEAVVSKRHDTGRSISYKDVVQNAINNESYEKAITDGTLSPEKVQEIIKSSGLEVPEGFKSETEPKTSVEPIKQPLNERTGEIAAKDKEVVPVELNEVKQEKPPTSTKNSVVDEGKSKVEAIRAKDKISKGEAFLLAKDDLANKAKIDGEFRQSPQVRVEHNGQTFFFNTSHVAKEAGIKESRTKSNHYVGTGEAENEAETAINKTTAPTTPDNLPLKQGDRVKYTDPRDKTERLGTVAKNYGKGANAGKNIEVHFDEPSTRGFSKLLIPEEKLNKTDIPKPKNKGEAGAVDPNLLALGIPSTIKEDVIPAIKGVARAITETRDGIKKLFFAGNRGTESEVGAGDLRHRLAQAQRGSDQAQAALKTARKYFASQKPEDNYKFIDAVESGNLTGLSDSEKAIASTMKHLLADAREKVQNLGTGKLQNFNENYFPHIWKDAITKNVEDANNSPANKTLEGSKAFLKKRIIRSFKEGRELGLTPVSDNPVDFVEYKIREMNRYIAAHDAIADMRKQGLVKMVRPGNEVPDGFTKINDKISDVWEMGADGRNQMAGHYYAVEPVSDLINNHLANGLQGRALYDLARQSGNFLNQFQLGLSAYHGVFSAINSITSKFSQGLYEIGNLQPVKGVKSLLSSPFEPVTSVIRGDKVLKAWLDPKNADPLHQAIADVMMQAGGRAKMDDFYNTKASRQMVDAFKQGNIIGGTLRIPTAILHAVNVPVMEKLIPRLKMGAFMGMAKSEIARLPKDATPEQFKNAVGKAWDSVDNRFGQLVYDNLFWNKTAKDAAMISTRAVGWNLGSLREGLGGVKDTATAPARAYKAIKEGASNSKGIIKTIQETPNPIITQRMAYVAALPIIHAIIGSSLNYMMTGQRPKDLEDMFFPRTGELDADGKPERLSIPTYVKDAFAYYKHPWRTIKGKANPLVNLSVDMLQNRDFFGTKIRNEDDPVIQQLLDSAKYIGGSLEPMSIRNLRKDDETGDTLGKKTGNFFGFTSAPADLDKSNAEELLGNIRGENAPAGAKSKEEELKQQTIRDLVRQQKRGQNISSEFSKAVAADILTIDDRRTIRERATTNYLEGGVKNLQLSDALKVVKVATPDEKAGLEKVIKEKIDNLNKERKLTTDELASVQKEFPNIKVEIKAPRNLSEKLKSSDVQNATNLYLDRVDDLNEAQKNVFKQKLKRKIFDANRNGTLTQEEYDSAKQVLPELNIKVRPARKERPERSRTPILDKLN